MISRYGEKKPTIMCRYGRVESFLILNNWSRIIVLSAIMKNDDDSDREKLY